MGNLDDALWIANPEYRAGGVSLFIRAFSVEEKPVRATLTITGLGWFASYLNGERTDDEYFKPLLSDYGERSFEDVRFYRPKGGIKRVYYHTFDVAHLLRAGENRLSVAVAAGWYDHREKPVEGNFAYGRPRLIFSLEYETKKGCGRFVSDGNAFVKSLPAAATLFTSLRRQTNQLKTPASAGDFFLPRKNSSPIGLQKRKFVVYYSRTRTKRRKS